MSFITRFAPSPTGLLHLGHAYSAMLAHGLAQTAHGLFVLRIEDIDATRCRPEFEAAIFNDLAWLGLSWPTPVRRQSEHMADYSAALDTLRGLGVVYRCFLTRREIAEQAASAPHGPGEGPEGHVYTGPIREMSVDEQDARIARGESFAWRLSIKYSQDLLGEDFPRLVFRECDERSNTEQVIAARPQMLGDVILARKDAPTSYHLSVVHDDACAGVTCVIRGEDLRASTHIHVLLQKLLGLSTPIYLHHRLLTGPDGKRYAKRDLSLTLAALRKAGVSVAEIRSRIGLSA